MSHRSTDVLPPVPTSPLQFGAPSTQQPVSATFEGNQTWEPMRILQALCAAVLLAYVVCLMVFSPTAFPATLHSASHWPALMDKPTGEDGFYMLTVARNIATTGHILYNGGIVATGIQPLATFVFAGLQLLVQKQQQASMDLIRVALLLGAVLFIAFAVQISHITRQLSPAKFRTLAGAFAFLFILTDFTLFRLFTYGLETGIYLICLAACFSSTLRIAQAQRTTLAESLWLGVAAGLAGEARIDFGVLFALIMAGLVMKRWMSPLRALTTGTVALIIVSPWFLFLHRVSGSWMPSSGPAESSPLAASNLVRRLASMVPAVAGHLMPWVYGVKNTTSGFAIALSLIVLSVLLWRNRHEILLPLAASTRSLILVWAASIAVLIVIYFALFNSSQFYYRYTAPLVVISVPLLAVVLSGVGAARRHAYAVAGVLIASFLGWTLLSLHSGRVGNIQSVVAGYVLQNFPATHVGAFQSGVVGYFNPNVENLDGKLNAPALEATKHHALPQFIDHEHINVLVDWPDVIHAYLPSSYLAATWKPCAVPMQTSEAICLVRK